MADASLKRAHRKRRHLRVRTRVAGTAQRPRLVVFRSLRGIYAQVVDDVTGKTIASAGSDSAELKKAGNLKKTEAAGAVGKLIAEKALAAGVQTVCFDRAGYRFHGRIKALADAARKQGLKF